MSSRKKKRRSGHKNNSGRYILISILVFALLFSVGLLKKSNRTELLSETTSSIIYVDHNSVDLFDSIPEEYLTAARNLHQVFSDRSVGDNIHEALNCLAGQKADGTYTTNWWQIKASCRVDYTSKSGTTWYWKTWNKTDYDNGTVPAQLLFDPDPIKYNRDNWTYEFKGGSWSLLTQDFIEVLAPQYIDSKDVLSYQFSYLNVTDNDNIADPQVGFFADNLNSYDIYDLENYISQHPDKTFIFWTSSLARGIGTQQATDFNNAMRQYAISNQKILFDVADIESHDPNGNPCYDNRDGVQFCTQTGNCEDRPDDNLNYPAICQDYTTEIEGGHLGSVSGAKIRIAKAYWVLMAQIAGWDPGQPQPTPPGVTATPIPTTPPPTAAPTATSAPLPTPTPTTVPPQGFTAIPGCSTVALSWAPIDGATGYYLARCPDEVAYCGGKWTQLFAHQPHLNYTDNDVSNDQVYSYRLQARLGYRNFTPYSFQTVTPSCN